MKPNPTRSTDGSDVDADPITRAVLDQLRIAARLWKLTAPRTSSDGTRLLTQDERRQQFVDLVEVVW